MSQPTTLAPALQPLLRSRDLVAQDAARELLGDPGVRLARTGPGDTLLIRPMHTWLGAAATRRNWGGHWRPARTRAERNLDLTRNPRGRPRDPAFHESILRAALDVFIESGVEGSSIERIARARSAS